MIYHPPLHLLDRGTLGHSGCLLSPVFNKSTLVNRPSNREGISGARTHLVNVINLRRNVFKSVHETVVSENNGNVTLLKTIQDSWKYWKSNFKICAYCVFLNEISHSSTVAHKGNHYTKLEYWITTKLRESLQNFMNYYKTPWITTKVHE